jgi:hypothetical protein
MRATLIILIVIFALGIAGLWYINKIEREFHGSKVRIKRVYER